MVPLSIFTFGALTFQHGKVKDLEEPQVAKQVQHPLAVPLGPGCGISILSGGRMPCQHSQLNSTASPVGFQVVKDFLHFR